MTPWRSAQNAASERFAMMREQVETRGAMTALLDLQEDVRCAETTEDLGRALDRLERFMRDWKIA
jgi:hypothetical protein